MPPTDDPSLSFQEVQDRFAESAAALSDIHSKAAALADDAERQQDAARSIEAASERLEGFTADVAALAAELQTAQQVLSEAFRAVKEAVDGSDLREVKDAVEDLDVRIVDSVAGVAGALAEAEGRLMDAGTGEQDEIKRLLDEIGQKLAVNQAVADERDAAVARANALQVERDKAVAAANEAQNQLDRLRAAAGGRIIRKAGLEE